MAHIYYGNRARFEENLDIVHAISQLSDDYWVLFEFDVPGGNIDCLVIRPARETTPPNTPSVLILTEIKHVAGRLVGLENGVWSIERNGIPTSYAPSNAADDNPWQQTLRVLNLFRSWMTNNQRVFLEAGTDYEFNQIKVWPTLLIVRTDSDEPHGLPLGPTNRFGSFCFGIEEWLRNVSTWVPRVGIQLTASDADRLVRTLQLTEWSGGTQVSADTDIAVPATAPPDAPPEAEVEAAVGADIDTPHIRETFGALPGRLEWVDGLIAWASELERRVQALESRSRESWPSAPTAFHPNGTTRPLTDEERSALIEATRDVVRMGQARAFPSVVRSMSAKLGYDLKTRSYNGFGTAKNLFSQAEREGIIKFGPLLGPAPTIYLEDEELPDEPPM